MKELIASAKENVLFLLVCLAVSAVLLLVGKLGDRLRDPRPVHNTRYVVIVAMCGALSGLLMLLEFPLLIIAPAFYKLDFGDLPALFAGIWLGPMAGVISELLKVLLKLVLKGTSSAFVGEFASFLVGCSLVLPVSLLARKQTKKCLDLSLGVGILSLAVVGPIFNYFYLIPRYAALFGMPLEAILSAGAAIVPAANTLFAFAALIVAPFNLIKGVLVSIIAYFLAPRLRKAVRL